jgi:hypothetical protein
MNRPGSIGKKLGFVLAKSGSSLRPGRLGSFWQKRRLILSDLNSQSL